MGESLVARRQSYASSVPSLIAIVIDQDLQSQSVGIEEQGSRRLLCSPCDMVCRVRRCSVLLYLFAMYLY